MEFHGNFSVMIYFVIWLGISTCCSWLSRGLEGGGFKCENHEYLNP